MRRHFLSLVIALPLLAASPALAAAGGADSKSAEPGKSLDPADGFFEKGKAAFNAGKTEEAYALYQKAWALKQTHDIAGNLAQAELKLGKKREAFEHITFALAHFPPSVTPDPRPALEKVLAGLKQQLGVLRVKVNVAGARVSIDGRVLPESQSLDEVVVEPGPHTVVAELAGYVNATSTETGTAGAPSEVTLTLVKAAPLGKVEPVKQAQKPHVLPLSGGPRVPVIVTGGVAAGAAVIAGVIFVVISNGKSSDVDEQLGTLRSTNGVRACTGTSVPTGCTTVQDTIAAKDTFANLALWSFVGAGALGIGTAVYALAAPKAAKKTELRASPVVTATGGGIVIGGAW